jgi:hypothetical protein
MFSMLLKSLVKFLPIEGEWSARWKLSRNGFQEVREEARTSPRKLGNSRLH